MAMFVSVTCSWLVACATASETTQTSVESLVFDVRLCTAAVSTSSSTSSVPGAAGETTGKSDTNHTMRMSASVKWITGRCVLSVPARGAVRLSYAAESRSPSTSKTSEGEKTHSLHVHVCPLYKRTQVLMHSFTCWCTHAVLCRLPRVVKS